MSVRRKAVFSDLTGELIADRADEVQVAVYEHPALASRFPFRGPKPGPVTFDAAISELGNLADMSATVVELRFANRKKMRLTIATEDFDALAVKKPMAELLLDAYYIAEMD